MQRHSSAPPGWDVLPVGFGVWLPPLSTRHGHGCVSLPGSGGEACGDASSGTLQRQGPCRAGGCPLRDAARTDRRTLLAGATPRDTGGTRQSPAWQAARANPCEANISRRSLSWSPGILLRTQELPGKQMLMVLCCTVGISLTGSVFFICSTGDKKPRVFWETGRPYLPSQAASGLRAALRGRT